jgi:Uma2 family endonuclease
MSTITQTTQPAAGPDGDCYPLYRMPLEQYEAMVDSGVFTKDDRFELVDGLLVKKMTQNDPHSTADLLTRDALQRVVPAGWHVRSDKPVRMPPDSKPEPDQSVVRGAVRDYKARSPEPADVGLVVQVAVRSLARDRKRSPWYAANGIPVYWIVNVLERQVEVYSSPTSDGYGARQIYMPGDNVPVVLDGAEVGQIAVDDILP